MARTELEDALREAGDAASHTARLRRLLAAELDRGMKELAEPRSGYGEPITVAIAAGLLAVVPVAATFRVDMDVAPKRGRQLVEVLMDVLGDPLAGSHGAYLALAGPADDPSAAAELFDEGIAGVDRLKARAVVVPEAVLDVAGLRPFARAAPAAAVAGPHDDVDRTRRIARRMLLTLRGKGKWGGYHTEFTNLARGFQGEWELAERVGESMVAAGLLIQKPSVGQRHVSLNPRRKGDIDRLIDDAVVPSDLTLPFT
ncbi:MAG: hypothetical protein QOI80_2209 [Solirubrobacteraceae bacterium]|nr:hypothetical protein [Solirubrobacteraceae bacterium]